MAPAASTQAPSASERLERHLGALEPWIPRLVERLRQYRQEHGDPEPWGAEQLQEEAERLEAWLDQPSGTTTFSDPRLLEGFAELDQQLEPTGCTSLEGLNLECIHDLAADLQYFSALSEAARFCLDQGWRCNPQPCFSSPRGLMVHGVGSGRYLPAILERSQADVVLLLEPDLGRLLSALVELDLAALMAPFSGPGRAFFLDASSDPDQVFEEVGLLLCQTNLFVLDALLVCDTDATPATAALIQRFNAERNTMLINYLGYFVDELHMLMNATVNFRHLGAKVVAPGVLPPHRDHAVVAVSGPSLRQHLPMLRAERERYTLFSGWSTLGTLLQAGLVPDYHCPMERHVVHDALQLPTVAPHLGSIRLVGPASLDPRQIEAYADRLLLFRSASAASALYAEKDRELIDGEGPLTVNMAAIAAVLLGFRHLHFLGADFGAVEQQDDRMEHALLYTNYSFDRTEVGVGGARVHTDALMLDARRALERLLAGWYTSAEPVKGFNFSGGLTISGAPETEASRFAALLRRSRRQPSPVTSLPRRAGEWAERRWRVARLRDRSLHCLHTLRQLVDPVFEPATLLAITSLTNLVNTPLLEQIPARLYRGTVFRIWFGLLMLHRRLQFPDAAAEAAWLAQCRAILHRVIDSLEALSFELFDYLEDLGGLDGFTYESRRRSVS